MIDYFTANFDISLLIGSFVVAVLGAYVGLTIMRLAMMQPEKQDRRRLAALAGLTFGGIGLWSTHFIGVLARHGDVSRDLSLSMLALLIAVVVAGAGLAALVGAAFSIPRLLMVGLIVGAGVVAMYATGSSAIDAELRYSTLTVGALAAAIIVAVTAVLLLLMCSFGALKSLLSALLIGVVVCATHYASMFVVSVGGVTRRGSDDVVMLGVVIIVDVCVAVLAIALGHISYHDTAHDVSHDVSYDTRPAGASV